MLEYVMERCGRHGGKTAIAVAVCLFGILVSVFLAHLFDAEAVIGEQGNLRSASGHKHNFSTGSGGVEAVDESRICVFCHTPHNAQRDDAGAPLINAPLWNHTLSSPSLTYNVKVANTLVTGASIGNVILRSQPRDKPDGASRLCLSCHDGTVSVGNVRSMTGGIEMDTSGGGCLDTDGSIANACSAYIGTDLTTKHVVSVPMNDALKTQSYTDCVNNSPTTHLEYPWDTGNGDDVLLRPTTATYGGSPGVTRTTGKYKGGYNYGVQCSTCHDPHYWSSSAGVGYKFVVVDNSSGALCTACHVSDCP